MLPVFELPTVGAAASQVHVGMWQRVSLAPAESVRTQEGPERVALIMTPP